MPKFNCTHNRSRAHAIVARFAFDIASYIFEVVMVLAARVTTAALIVVIGDAMGSLSIIHWSRKSKSDSSSGSRQGREIW